MGVVKKGERQAARGLPESKGWMGGMVPFFFYSAAT